MQILKETGIDWCETSLINKLYMDQTGDKYEDWKG
jgi:hypothetical protein